MKTTLLKIALILLTVFLVYPSSTLSHPAQQKSNHQLYTVSLPVGYGALSAYNALPSALHHAPYALKGLSYLMSSSKTGAFRALDFQEDIDGKSANRLNYNLDRETFVKLFGHEFQDQNRKRVTNSRKRFINFVA